MYCYVFNTQVEKGVELLTHYHLLVSWIWCQEKLTQMIMRVTREHLMEIHLAGRCGATLVMEPKFGVER